MPRKITDVVVNSVGVVDAGMNLKGRFPIAKRKEQMADLKETFETALESPVEGEDDFAKRFESDEDRAAAVAAYRYADACGLRKMFEQPEPVEADELEDNDNDGEDEMSDELANVSEGIAKRFEILQKQLDDEKAARLETEQKLEKARDQRELDQWVAKAKENLQYVPGKSTDELAGELHKMAKLDADLAVSQYERLCEVSQMLAKSKAFEAVGTGGTQGASDEERIQKRAAELSADGKMSKVEAFKAAVRETRKR